MVKKDLRIIYVGPLQPHRTCTGRMHAMQDLGFDIAPIDTRPDLVERIERNILYRAVMKWPGPVDWVGANPRILDFVRTHRFAVLWLDKALSVKARTLRIARTLMPSLVIAGYSPDDMGSSHNQSPEFRKALRWHDIYFTTKSYGPPELEALGCPKAVFVSNAFDRSLHRPLTVTDQDRLLLGGRVGFIGDYERERARTLLFLARQGIKVRIWGPNWKEKRCFRHPNMIIESRPLWGDDYARAMCSFEINLGFLRKVNRDLQTQRSIHIPACRAFMLAERTDEHRALFEEGKEAEYFGSDEECLSKIRYYLGNPDKRRAIAQAGYERCYASKYSTQDVIPEMFEEIAKIRWTRTHANP